jgi:pimeloyl-ACP methyl ester carboxylesterase
MQIVRSDDGTKIAYEQEGSGPPLILVDGALTSASSGTKKQLSSLLAADFTVLRYDRRGRGSSADTQPYAVGREIEDLGAMLAQAGGSAFVYGHSSGACLVLEALAALPGKVGKAALYEAPYQESSPAWQKYLADLSEYLAAGRNEDAVAAFMTFVGTPQEHIDLARRAAFWPDLAALAPTLAYDHIELLGTDPSVPASLTARIKVPVLVLAGGDRPAFWYETASALTAQLARAQSRTLLGEDHNVSPAVLAPILTEFFLDKKTVE